MVSHAEQGERLKERLERPDKFWKYNPGDIDVRERWDTYQAAYAAEQSAKEQPATTPAK